MPTPSSDKTAAATSPDNKVSGTAPLTISLVVPAFNEEKNIGPTIEKATLVLERLTEAHEIIIINDGSADGTARVVREHAARDERIRLIDFPQNRGMGAAVRAGLESARMDWVFETCADLQFDLDEIVDFIPLIEDADMVIGYRTNLKSGPLRSFVTWTYRQVTRVLFDLQVRDPSWVKMIRTEKVHRIPLESEGFFWETEILVRARLAGLRMKQVGVHWHPRVAGEASGGNPWRVLEAVWTLLQFWWRGAATRPPENQAERR